MTEDEIATWPAMRLVMEKRIMLDGLDRMSIDDVETANRYLDAWHEVAYLNEMDARRESEKGR